MSQYPIKIIFHSRGDNMENEIWKDIAGYEGKYQVSNRGRVKSLNYNRTGQERILKVGNVGNGYLGVILYKNGKIKRCKIHRLVTTAFIPNPDNLPEVNHKDKNKTNNCVDNLEWCTTQYNIDYSKSKQVIGIHKVTGLILEFSSTMEAERITNIPNGNISKCCKGRRKSAGGYIWMYTE